MPLLKLKATLCYFTCRSCIRLCDRTNQYCAEKFQDLPAFKFLLKCLMISYKLSILVCQNSSLAL